MKTPSMRILKGMIETSLRRDSHRDDETYEKLKQENLPKIKKANQQAAKELITELYAHPEKYMEVIVNNDKTGEFTIQKTKARNVLEERIMKKYRVQVASPMYRTVYCYSLDISTRYSMSEATLDKYTKLFQEIDEAFIRDDGAEIMAIIKKYLG